jgi:hypothetical protein
MHCSNLPSTLSRGPDGQESKADSGALQSLAGKTICLIRGQRVMLDRDLAALYGVTTGNLNKAVKRNIERFPQDFVLHLTREEVANLIFQTGRSSWGGHRKPPYAFTEQGVAMLSSVLRSRRAAMVNVEIMRTFVRLREMLSSHKDLSRKLEALERKYDAQFKVVFDAIRRLMAPAVSKPRQMGFHTIRKPGEAGG